jgi:hypothetical protein
LPEFTGRATGNQFGDIDQFAGLHAESIGGEGYALRLHS